METDCYILLGISSDADEKTIRKAWRLKTKEAHPDLNPSNDALEKFAQLSEAMEILLDPTSRLKHDHAFGYIGKPKNKSSNNKQKFSEEQNKKAKKNVDEWSVDFNTAMEMREQQRQKHLRRHRRNQKLILLLFGLLVAGTLVLLWRFFL